jgi:hypothetical protein
MGRWAVIVALCASAACTFDSSGLPSRDLPGREPARDLQPEPSQDRAGSDRDGPLGVDRSPDRAVDRSPDLSCAANATRACYNGPAVTLNKGECKAGTEICAAGVWGACVGEVKPTTEVCDGKDNDCDGQTDGALPEVCTYTGPAGTNNVGECKAGSKTCSGGVYSACAGEVKPATEICDTKDNDCDGKTDEGFSPKCESLACKGKDLIHKVGNLCVDNDGGSSGSSDELEVYCCDGIARFCLSKETCPWRPKCGATPGDATCSRAGLSSDFMADAHCELWNKHAEYYCSPTGQIYFTK